MQRPEVSDTVLPVKFLIADSRDNVATAVCPIGRGETLAVVGGAGGSSITVEADIPFGHKFALNPMSIGEAVIKYGETIGLATLPIRPGDHVHVHNVEGVRGRGDKT